MEKNMAKEFFKTKKELIMKVNSLKMKNMEKECFILAKGNMMDNLQKESLMGKGNFIIQTETLIKDNS